LSERTNETLPVGTLLRRFAVWTPEMRAQKQREHDIAAANERATAAGHRLDMFSKHLERCGVARQVARDSGEERLAETAALREMEQWLWGDERHLLLSGGTGAGKSVAASRALSVSVRRAGYANYDSCAWSERGALWLPFGELCRLSDYEDADKNTLRFAQRVPMLVLDDVGTGDAVALTPRERQRLEELADHRDDPERRTVWTTNLSIKRAPDAPSEFGRFVGSRVSSRIARSVRAVDCGKQDMRRGL